MALVAKTISIQGTTPLLLHNGSLADPLNPISLELKKVSGKRAKTEADHLEMGRLEWTGSWYLDEKERPIIPAVNIKACLVNGAKVSKMGASVKRSLWVVDHMILEFEGNQTALSALWADETFQHVALVKIGTSKVRRTRPIVNKWAGSFEIRYDDGVFDEDVINQIIEAAGQIAGLGDWGPRNGGMYGQFAQV